MDKNVAAKPHFAHGRAEVGKMREPSLSPNWSKSASGRQARAAGAAVVIQEILEKHPACGGRMLPRLRLLGSVRGTHRTFKRCRQALGVRAKR